MGLGHRPNPAQLMYAEVAEHTSNTGQSGVGDLTGLRLVAGKPAGCLASPPVPGG